MTIDIGGGFGIVTRAEWGARPPNCTPDVVPWSQRVGVAYHIQAGNRNTGPKGFQNYAMDSLGYCDSHYNFMVNSDLASQYGGNYIFEMRGATIKAAHASNNNTAWIGIVTAGQNADVTGEDLDALAAMHSYLEQLGGKQLQYAGHQQLPGASTSCPGATIMNWLAAGGPDQGNTDMSFTKEDAKTLFGSDVYYVDKDPANPADGPDISFATTQTTMFERLGGLSGVNPFNQILSELAAIRARLDVIESGDGTPVDVDAVADEIAKREAAAARAAADAFEESI